MRRRAVLPFALLGLWACTKSAVPAASDASGTDASIPRTHVQYFSQTIETDVDLLFMVDNTEENTQNNLQRQFPRLVEAMRDLKLGPIAPGATCMATDKSGCRIPNLRIGVISSDLGAGPYSFQTCETPGGDRGILKNSPGALAPPGCPTPTDRWIQYIDMRNSITTNVQGAKSTDPVEQVKEAFSCITYLGTGGCGFEHQLESAKRALDGCQASNNSQCKTNPGFIRQDALLAVFFLTDEDDCSARRGELFDPTQQGLDAPLGPLRSFRCTEFGLVCAEKLREPGVKHNCAPGLDYLYPVDSYIEFFRGLKPPGRVILSALAGPIEPFEVGLDGVDPALKASCMSAVGNGDPGIRIASVVKSFGDQGLFNVGIKGDQKIEVNICSVDYSPALHLLGETIVGTLGEQCLSAPLLTTTGGLACHKGDDLGSGVRCAQSCLDKVDCVVEEKVGLGASTPGKECSAALFDPAIKQNACGAECPCWRIIPSTACLPKRDGSPYALQIMRVGEARKGTVAAVRCATPPFAWGTAELAALPQCK